MFAAKSKMILHLQNSWTINKRLSDFNFFFAEWEVVSFQAWYWIRCLFCYWIPSLKSEYWLITNLDNWTNFPKELTIADGCGWLNKQFTEQGSQAQQELYLKVLVEKKIKKSYWGHPSLFPRKQIKHWNIELACCSQLFHDAIIY